MRSALDRLQDAKRNLQSVTADKGGHRVKAIRCVNGVIDEVMPLQRARLRSSIMCCGSTALLPRPCDFS